MQVWRRAVGSKQRANNMLNTEFLQLCCHTLISINWSCARKSGFRKTVETISVAEDHAVRSKNLQVIWMWHQTTQTHSSSWFWALLILGSYSSVWPGIIPLTAITIELQLYDMQGFVRNQCIFSFLFKEGNTSVIPHTEMRTHKK